MKRNVSWPVDLWETYGKEIRTKGYAYIGSAMDKDVAVLWSYSGKLHNVVSRLAKGEAVSKEECKSLVAEIQTKIA